MREGSIIILLKGLCVGGTMMVPGISGGSMAMILGVYDKLISSVSSLRKHVKESLIFLTLFSLGGGIGMLLLARPLFMLIESYERPMLCLFIGIVMGSIPMIFRKAAVKELRLSVILYPLIGFCIVVLLGKIPSDIFRLEEGNHAVVYLMLLMAGVISAIALVLPGISVSYMLLLLGLYDKIIDAIGRLYFPLLIPLGLGLIVGVFATTRLLERMMTRHTQPTYLVILGFVLGSVAELMPGIPQGIEWVFCIACLIAGLGIIRIILHWGD